MKRGNQIRVALVLAVCLALSSGVLSLAFSGTCVQECDARLFECYGDADTWYYDCVYYTGYIPECSAAYSLKLAACGVAHANCLVSCRTTGPGTPFPGGDGPVHIAPK